MTHVVESIDTIRVRIDEPVGKSQLLTLPGAHGEYHLVDLDVFGGFLHFLRSLSFDILFRLN